MPHPAAYAVTFVAVIGVAIGAAIFSYLSSQNRYEPQHRHQRRKPDLDFQFIDDGSMCTICLENVHHDRRYLQCGHVFHNRCIDKWLRHKDVCPNCMERAA